MKKLTTELSKIQTKLEKLYAIDNIMNSLVYHIEQTTTQYDEAINDYEDCNDNEQDFQSTYLQQIQVRRDTLLEIKSMLEKMI